MKKEYKKMVFSASTFAVNDITPSIIAPPIDFF